MNKTYKIAFFLLTGSILIIALSYFVFHFELLSIIQKPDIQLEKPNNGTYKTYYDDGRLRSEEYYVHGLKNGTFLHYYPNGVLKYTATYKKGKITGSKIYYSTTGELVFEECYDNGRYIRQHITNDSLFNYEFNLLTHGKNLFKSQCTNCHEQNTGKLYESLHVQSLNDSSKHMLARIDSIHHQMIDSLFFEDEEQVNFLEVFQLGKYDLKAILEFLEVTEGAKHKNTNPKQQIKKKQKPKLSFFFIKDIPLSGKIDNITVTQNRYQKRVLQS